jgi:proline dehydrogenase
VRKGRVARDYLPRAIDALQSELAGPSLLGAAPSSGCFLATARGGGTTPRLSHAVLPPALPPSLAVLNESNSILFILSSNPSSRALVSAYIRGGEPADPHSLGLIQSVVYGAAKRWIAGKDMETALSNARDANANGLGTILNYLGEDISDPGLAGSHFDEYLRLQMAINDSRIDGCVSVKLTQVGLDAGGRKEEEAEGRERQDSLIFERMKRLADAAESMNQMLWIDMEGSALTTRTLEIYSKLLLDGHKNVGVALQAYLRRSEADLQRLMELGGKVRLVKGAYREAPEVAYSSREQITQSYLRLLRTLFDSCEYFAVATHDSRPIEEAQELHRSKPSVKFEFEMLKGIRNDLKLTLTKSGYRVVDYLPYGSEWYAYSMRRIREHPSNVWLLLRSIF